MSGPLYPFGNDHCKIEGYRAFWNRESVGRPLVGFSYKSWFPLREFEASAAWEEDTELLPHMIEPEAFLADQERLLAEGEELGDDILRGASPIQGVPWIQGMLGSRIRILPASTLPEERILAWEDLESLELDTSNPWYLKYMEFAEALVDRSAGRFPVSHGTLVGPSDLVGVLRGHTQSIMDCMEEPDQAERLLWKVSGIFQQVTEDIWKRLPLFGGGTFDAQYQLWAPGPIVRMQEDAMAVYSPDLYRRFIQPVDRHLARQFSSAFMHLHSTSMFLLEAILEVEEIRCFEINVDAVESALSVEQMIPYFKMVQEAERSLLIRGSFSPDELHRLVDSLDPCGLYLYIMVESKEKVEKLKPLVGL
jgi:hypothetical protein